MQKVKDAAKVAAKTIKELNAGTDQAFIADQLRQVQEASALGAEAVDELMSEEVAPLIRNSQ